MTLYTYICDFLYACYYFAVRSRIEEIEILAVSFPEIQKGRLYDIPQLAFITSFISLIMLVIYIDILL